MRRLLPAALAVLLCQPEARAQGSPLEVVRYDGLIRAVNSAKGDVVVVDFWFDACLTCKREFPKLVALRERYAKQGFSAIAVNLDDPHDREKRADVEAFLKATKSRCRHLMLDEKTDAWQQKLKIEVFPCVFVFDRKGRLLARWDGDEVDYEVIERRVLRALKE